MEDAEEIKNNAALEAEKIIADAKLANEQGMKEAEETEKKVEAKNGAIEEVKQQTEADKENIRTQITDAETEAQAKVDSID